MLATLWCLLVRRLVWVWAGLFLLVVPTDFSDRGRWKSGAGCCDADG